MKTHKQFSPETFFICNRVKLFGVFFLCENKKKSYFSSFSPESVFLFHMFKEVKHVFFQE